jgi:2-phosphoglycerate kinase
LLLISIIKLYFLIIKMLKIPKVMFILGLPGCGKGTQGALLQERYGILHISAGEVIREEL